MREEIDELVSQYGPERLRVTYVVSGADETREACTLDEESSVFGRVDAALLKRTLPPPEVAPMVMVCGTDGFRDALAGPTTRAPPDPVTGKRGKKEQGPLKGMLAELGYRAEHVYKF